MYLLSKTCFVIIVLCSFFLLVQDLGRKDDLISMFYMMVEFWKGHLPWKGAQTVHEVVQDKMKYNFADLTPELPQLEKFGEHLNTLQ